MGQGVEKGAKPRLLFLTSQLPYPPHSGGVIKSWRLVEFLAKHYRLSVVSMVKGADRDHEAAFRRALPLAGYASEQVERGRSAMNLLASYLLSPTLNMYRNRSVYLRQKVRQMAADADLILVDHLEMAQYVPVDFNKPVVLHQHNAEYVMWEAYSKVMGNPVKKAILSAEAGRIRKAERAACLRASLVLASPNDQQKLAAIGVPSAKMRTTYHLGDDSLLAEPDMAFSDTQPLLLSLGTLSWQANAEGLVWFLEKVWPKLRATHPTLKAQFAGKAPTPELQAAVAASQGVDLLGFVPDAAPLYARSRVFIAPLRFGSGIKVKVVGAMYRGIPCVTTSTGIEGLGAVHGEHVLIGDTPEDQVAHVESLLTNEGLWSHIARSSRALAKERFSWDRMLAGHKQELDALLHHS
jgi:polysaccharide biosynthesis protein PslH